MHKSSCNKLAYVRTYVISQTRPSQQRHYPLGIFIRCSSNKHKHAHSWPTIPSEGTTANMHTHDQLSRQRGKLQCTNFAWKIALPLWDRFHFVPLIWLHENTGRVTIGFAERSNIKVILTLVYFGVNVIIPSASLLASHPTPTTMHTHDPLSSRRANCNVQTLLGFFALPLWDRFHFVPLIWLHENTGCVTSGFAERGKIKVILTLVYVGVWIAYPQTSSCPVWQMPRIFATATQHMCWLTVPTTSLSPRHLYSLLIQQPQACTHMTNYPVRRANCNVQTLPWFLRCHFGIAFILCRSFGCTTNMVVWPLVLLSGAT